MFKVSSFDATDRSGRSDIEEYRFAARKGGATYACQLWWDDQPGAEPEGWCVRLVAPGSEKEQDIPVRGRRDGTSWRQLRRNVSAALNRWAIL